MVKRGVKRCAFVGRAAFHLDFPQSFVPSRLSRFAVRLEIVVRRFCREVFLCTFRASRREGGDDGQQSLVAEIVKLKPRLDCRPRAPPVRHDRHAVYCHARIGVGKAGLEKHALPPRPPFGSPHAAYAPPAAGFEAAVYGAVPVHRLAQVEQHDGFLAFRKGVPLYAAPLCGGEFHADAVVFEAYGVIAGVRLFLSVAEPTVRAERCCRRAQGFGDGEERDVVKVARPRAAQMGVTEAGYRAVGIEIACYPVPAGQPVVGAELHHAERHLRPGIGIAGVVGADKGIYDTAQLLFAGNLPCGVQWEQGEQEGKAYNIIYAIVSRMRIMRQAPGSQNFSHIEPMDTHVTTLCKASSEPNLFGRCRAQPKMSRKPLLETNVCARRAWNYALSAFQAQTLHEYERLPTSFFFLPTNFTNLH